MLGVDKILVCAKETSRNRLIRKRGVIDQINSEVCLNFTSSGNDVVFWQESIYSLVIFSVNIRGETAGCVEFASEYLRQIYKL